MELTYQQVLADVYDETAKNLLVFPREHDGEDLPPKEDYDYEANELEEPETFNKFHGDRNKPENIIQPTPPPKTTGKSNINHPTQIKNFVLNIDGNFRSGIVPDTVLIADPCTGLLNDSYSLVGTDPAEFTFMLSKNWKNIDSVKMTSMEFKNTFYTFSAARENSTFQVQVDGFPARTITIQDGNYRYLVNQTTGTPYSDSGATTPDRKTFLGAIMHEVIKLRNSPNNHSDLADFEVEYDEVIHQVFFSKVTANANIPFKLLFPSVQTNAYKNGIGYNLGFLQREINSINERIPGGLIDFVHRARAPAAPDIIQDYYVYLQINDWNLVEHEQARQTHYNVFAKIQLNGPKNTVIFDNNFTNSSTKEYFFEQPVNIQRLDISMLDAFGNTLDLRGAAFSMTLEFKQVNDSTVYEQLRQY